MDAVVDLRMGQHSLLIDQVLPGWKYLGKVGVEGRFLLGLSKQDISVLPEYTEDSGNSTHFRDSTPSE